MTIFWVKNIKIHAYKKQKYHSLKCKNDCDRFISITVRVIQTQNDRLFYVSLKS